MVYTKPYKLLENLNKILIKNKFMDNSAIQQNTLQDPRLLVLLKEYEIINIKIEQFLIKQPNMFGAGIIAILGIIGLYANGYESNITESLNKTLEINHFLAIMALPFFTLFYMCIIGYHYMRTMTLQGYKRVLEDEINKYVNKNCLKFSIVGMEIEKTNKFAPAFFLGLGILLLFSMAVPVLFVSHYCDHLTEAQKTSFCISIILYLLFFLWSIYAATQINKSFNKAVSKTKEAFSKAIETEN